MHDLSVHAERFNEFLRQTDPKDQDYLALVYILGEHLTDIKNGICACSIVTKDMYNAPEDLNGILEIIETDAGTEAYPHRVVSKCLGCGKTYESKEVEWGHGQKVYWTERS